MADSIEEVEQVEENGRIACEEAIYSDCTKDGSIDWKGRHAAIRGRSGGWRVGMILLINQALVTLALFGVGVNLVLFMTKVLKQDNAEAANNISKWTGTTYVFSLVGAFLSDSYWGRYKTCAIFQFIFAAIALGNGAYQPAATTFGADQFDETDPQEAESKVAFFSYFYLANNLGTIFSNTYMAYLEDKGKWFMGFGISAGAAFIALLLFIAGTQQYRHFRPAGNPLSRFIQVIVAAYKKRNVGFPQHLEELYEVSGNWSCINEGRKIEHTQNYKFLDRAAMLTTKDAPVEDRMNRPSPWQLCTVTQVEEVKCILRLIPIWLSTIVYSVVYAQMASVFVEQGNAMKTSIYKFHIPAASMSLFEILGVTLFVLLYRFLSFRQKKGNFRKLTELERMGFGLAISCISMILAGIVESQRLKHAVHDCDSCEFSSSLIIVWQVPQYVIIGASEVFTYVAMLEFFNDQAPEGLKSFGSALYLASMSLGNYVSSLIVAIVMGITRRGGKAGWISKNLNQGHLDNFFYLLAALSVINLIVFVACAKGYKYIKLEYNSDVGTDN